MRKNRKGEKEKKEKKGKSGYNPLFSFLIFFRE
jgi:hypothetical protein